MSDAPVLRKHRLAHIPRMEVHESIFRTRFAKTCSMSNCRGMCCSDGVDVDVRERDKILDHAELIRSQMDHDQERDSAKWFGEPFADADHPSGHAATTRVRGRGCVFLNKDGRCVVQMAEAQAPPQTGTLKPFYCRAYPIYVNLGGLMLDDEECTQEFQCCTAVDSGPLTIFDICAYELEFVLGADGVEELREIAREVLKAPETP